MRRSVRDRIRHCRDDAHQDAIRTATTGVLGDAIERLVAEHRRGATLVLLFDYDGTLVPIGRHPALARLGPGARRRLGWLSRRSRVVVGVASGRSLRDVTRMVGLPRLVYAGTSGLELLIKRRVIVPPRASRARALVARAGRRLAAGLALSRGVWVEEKPLGLAVHYRAVPRGRRLGVCADARRLLAPFGDALRVTEGPMALEVTPNVGWTKGTAVRTIVRRVAPGDAAVLYAGDAPNDREAFLVTAELGGVCVGVGAQAPREAAHRVRNPGALARLLDGLLRALSRSGG